MHPEVKKQRQLHRLSILAAFKKIKNLRKTGEKFGISRERVRQIAKEFGYKKPKRKQLSLQEKTERRLAKKVKRFWARVKKKTEKECWEWQGYCDPAGYGRVSLEGKGGGYAHRIAFELYYGTSVSEWVLHSCDNPPCVNPSHLREGTPKDNTADRNLRGRSGYQVDYDGWLSKLKEGQRKSPIYRNLLGASQVIEIRKRYKRGESATALASEFSCHRATVCRIARGATYSDIT